MQVLDLAYADDVALMASSLEGLQQLLDLVCNFCALMGMVVSVPKTKVMVFNVAFPGPASMDLWGREIGNIHPTQLPLVQCTEWR